MASHTVTWDATFRIKPEPSDAAGDGDDKIVEFKTALEERFDEDHIIGASITDGAGKDGNHNKVTLKTQTAPSALADTVLVHATDVSGEAELFAKKEDGDSVQLTTGDSIGKSGQGIIGNLTGSATQLKTFDGTTLILRKDTFTGNSIATSSLSNYVAFEGISFSNTNSKSIRLCFTAISIRFEETGGALVICQGTIYWWASA